MRKFTLIVAALMVPAWGLNADTCIRMTDHTEAYYHHGQMDPAVDGESTIWIGEGKVAYLLDQRNLIFDLDADSFTVILLSDSIFVRTALPLDLSLIVAEEVVPRLAIFPTLGETEAVGEKKTIGERECTAWKTTTWIPYQGERFNETERISWMTGDVPFDWKELDKVKMANLKFSNFSDELIEGILGFGGFELASESIRYSEGTAIKSSTAVTSITDEEPPAGIYEVPDGFTRRERMPARL